MDDDDRRAEVNGVRIDQVSGLGNVPFNQSVDYHGFVVMMRPSSFLAVSEPMGAPRDGFAHVLDAVRRGEAIASPFLKVDFPEGGGPPEIHGHEGRHRMLAVLETVGDVEIPVHVFPRGLRARHVTGEMIDRLRAAALRENQTGRPDEVVEGPLFGDAVLMGAALPFDAAAPSGPRP
jgi:hypothetical protein